MRETSGALPNCVSSAGSKPSWPSSASSAAHAALAPGTPAGVAAPVVADPGGVGTFGADVLRQRREQPGEQRVGGRVEAEPWGAGSQEVEVLGPADGAAVHRLDVDEPGVAEAVEVEPHGVRVQPEAVGEVLGRHGRSRPGELLVHGVAGLVTQCFEHRELIHDLTVAACGHIFKTEAVFIWR